MRKHFTPDRCVASFVPLFLYPPISLCPTLLSLFLTSSARLLPHSYHLPLSPVILISSLSCPLLSSAISPIYLMWTREAGWLRFGPGSCSVLPVNY